MEIVHRVMEFVVYVSNKLVFKGIIWGPGALYMIDICSSINKRSILQLRLNAEKELR